MSCFLDPSKVHCSDEPWWHSSLLIRCVPHVPGDAAEGDTHLAPDESRLSFISSPLTSPAHSSSETGWVRVAWPGLLWISRAPLIFTRTPRLPAQAGPVWSGAGLDGCWAGLGCGDSGPGVTRVMPGRGEVAGPGGAGVVALPCTL